MAASTRVLGRAHLFRSRALRALSRHEGHRLPFAELAEIHALARRLMEEVLAAVRGGHETESLLNHEPLDRSCC